MPDPRMPDAAPFEDAVTFFYVTDLARSHAFWHDAVGLPLVLDQGGCRIYRISPSGFVGFCQRAESDVKATARAEAVEAMDFTGPGRGPILTLVSEDVDGWAARLRAAGLRLETEPRRTERFGIYHFFFRDPDGLLAEVQRFEDPGWKRG